MLGRISNMKLRYKVGAGVATTAAIVGIGGAAFAYLSETTNVNATGGTGSVTPSSGTPANVSWSAGTATGLVPGGSSVDVTLSFSNTNTYSVNIGAWQFAVNSVSGPTGCADNTVADLSGSATTTAPFVVPPGTSTKTFTVPVSMGDLVGTDQSPCIGHALTVTFGAADKNSPEINA